MQLNKLCNLRKFRSQLSFQLSTINAIEQTVQSLEIQVTTELSVVHNQCNWTNCAIFGNSGHNWAFSCPQSMLLNKLCNLWKFRSQLSFQLSTINATEQTVQSLEIQVTIELSVVHNQCYSTNCACLKIIRLPKKFIPRSYAIIMPKNKS